MNKVEAIEKADIEEWKQHLDHTFINNEIQICFITAFEHPGSRWNSNLTRNSMLTNDIRMKLRFNLFFILSGVWNEDKNKREDVLVVWAPSRNSSFKNRMLELGLKYDQKTILVKDTHTGIEGFRTAIWNCEDKKHPILEYGENALLPENIEASWAKTRYWTIKPTSTEGLEFAFEYFVKPANFFYVWQIINAKHKGTMTQSQKDTAERFGLSMSSLEVNRCGKE